MSCPERCPICSEPIDARHYDPQADMCVRCFTRTVAQPAMSVGMALHHRVNTGKKIRSKPALSDLDAEGSYPVVGDLFGLFTRGAR